MDERDLKDKEEWEKRNNPAQKKPIKFTPRAPDPNVGNNSEPVDWRKKLGISYFLSSLVIWPQRAIALGIIGWIIYASFYIAVPYISNNGLGRYDKDYQAPIFICELKDAEWQYGRSDLFKDYYNFRRHEIRHYQREIWTIDGQLRQKYPDKAFIIDMPPIPENYSTDDEVFEKYGVFMGPKQYSRNIDVSKYLTPIRVIENNGLVNPCLYDEAASDWPVRQLHAIEYVSDKIGKCRTCKGAKPSTSTNKPEIPDWYKGPPSTFNPNVPPPEQQAPAENTRPSNPHNLPTWEHPPLPDQPAPQKSGTITWPRSSNNPDIDNRSTPKQEQRKGIFFPGQTFESIGPRTDTAPPPVIYGEPPPGTEFYNDDEWNHR